MKSFFFAAAMTCFYSGKPATFYFSSLSGNDSYTSTQAKHPSTPWRTLNKLNSFFSSLQPGDSVLFKRGETFYGCITVNKSGAPGQPIILSAYGTGSNPVITSLVRITNWVSAGNGIWAGYHAALGAAVNVVLLNGAAREMGRYPNSNAANKGYLTIDSYKSNVSITDNELPSSPDWDGGEVVIRKYRWVIERALITSHSGSTISYASPSTFVAPAGFGYFIQNHIKTLDQFGEWYYQASAKKVNVYFGSQSPSSYTVEAPALENVVYSSGFSYIVFSGLTFRGANGDSFRISGGNGFSVTGCAVLFSGKNGFRNSSHHHFTLKNSSVIHSNCRGIEISGSNDYPVISNNRVENTGLFAGMGEATGPNGTAVQCYGKGAVIEYNTVLNSGYNGIAIKLNATAARHNFISGFCSVKDDGGGIYTHNGSNNVYTTGASITGNIVLHGTGAPEGTPSPGTSNAEGIYLDDNANNADVRDNTVASCTRGIFLHNARNIRVVNNTLFNNHFQFYARHDKLGDPIRNLTVTNNVFFSKLPVQTVSYIDSRLDDISIMGRFDSNFYARPLDDRIVIYTIYTNSAGTKVKRWYDLEGWRSVFGKDIHSKRSPLPIEPYILYGLAGSNKVPNGSFNTNSVSAFGNGCTLSCVNSHHFDGGCLQVVPSVAGSALSISVGPLYAAKKYELRYSLVGEAAMSLGANLRYGGSPYKPITPVVYRKVSTVRSENNILFAPSVDQSSGTLIFTLDGVNKYWLDNIQLFEANAAVTNPDDHIRFEYNATRTGRTVPLAGTYRSVQNVSYKDQIVLPPFSSVVLIKENTLLVMVPREITGTFKPTCCP